MTRRCEYPQLVLIYCCDHLDRWLVSDSELPSPTALSGLERHCSDLLPIHSGDAGLHVAAVFRAGLADVEVVRHMHQRGLTATALSSCYAGSPTRRALLLGLGGWDERRIGDATRTLDEVLREFA